MWRFYTTKQWALWAYLGGLTIIAAVSFSVYLDVQINEWFGDFYNMLQKALATPNSVTL